MPDRPNGDRDTTGYAVPSDPLDFEFAFEVGDKDGFYHIFG